MGGAYTQDGQNNVNSCNSNLSALPAPVITARASAGLLYIRWYRCLHYCVHPPETIPWKETCGAALRRSGFCWCFSSRAPVALWGKCLCSCIGLQAAAGQARFPFSFVYGREADVLGFLIVLLPSVLVIVRNSFIGSAPALLLCSTRAVAGPQVIICLQ